MTLYYNVKQRKTFDEVIEETLKSMDDGDERYALYETFLGTASGSAVSGGNHQTFSSPLPDSMDAYNNSIANGFGYDMQSWNTLHCAIAESGNSHQAIDILCSSGTPVYAGMSGTVDETTSNTIVLYKEGYSYWYDGDGYGKTRDTKIYYENVTPVSGLSAGSHVEEGDLIGYVNTTKQCDGMGGSTLGTYLHLAIEIDTDGIGWDFVDPRLLFY